MASKHGIRIPGLLLDELKSRDYSKDDRFNEPAKAKGKKRNPKGQLGRKERRKQQRLEKKSTKKGKTSGEDVRLKTNTKSLRLLTRKVRKSRQIYPSLQMMSFLRGTLTSLMRMIWMRKNGNNYENSKVKSAEKVMKPRKLMSLRKRRILMTRNCLRTVRTMTRCPSKKQWQR